MSNDTTPHLLNSAMLNKRARPTYSEEPPAGMTEDQVVAIVRREIKALGLLPAIADQVKATKRKKR